MGLGRDWKWPWNKSRVPSRDIKMGKAGGPKSDCEEVSGAGSGDWGEGSDATHRSEES